MGNDSQEDGGLVDVPANVQPDREQVLSLLDDALAEAHQKVESGRVYDAENERVRQGWFKTLGYLAGQYRQLLRDRDLEALSERVDALEAHTHASGKRTSTGSSADLLESAPRVTVRTGGDNTPDTDGDTGAGGPSDNSPGR